LPPLLLLLLLLLPDVPDVAAGIYSKLKQQWTKLKARSDEVRRQQHLQFQLSMSSGKQLACTQSQGSITSIVSGEHQHRTCGPRRRALAANCHHHALLLLLLLLLLQEQLGGLVAELAA
jgi:hypothetical protein